MVLWDFCLYSFCFLWVLWWFCCCCCYFKSSFSSQVEHYPKIAVLSIPTTKSQELSGINTSHLQSVRHRHSQHSNITTDFCILFLFLFLTSLPIFQHPCFYIVTQVSEHPLNRNRTFKTQFRTLQEVSKAYKSTHFQWECIHSKPRINLSITDKANNLIRMV